MLPLPPPPSPPIPPELDQPNLQILTDLNSNLALCGNSPTFPSNDPTNPLPNPIINSLFHDSLSFSTTFKNSSQIILASINIQSLQSKHSKLQELLSELSCTPLHILAIQETWAIPHTNLISIPGFNFIHSERKIGRGGGVGFYVKDSLTFKIIPNLSLFIPKIFECLTIEINLNNVKSSFSSIYRSPSDNPDSLNQFSSNLDSLLFEISSKYKHSYICLDSNINSLVYPTNQHHLNYFSTITSNGFIQCINKATRIVGNSSSLIDHIITNSSSSTITSGVIISDISDHFLTFVQLPLRQPRSLPKLNESRNFSKANMERFRDCLRALSWTNVINSDDPNESYNLFWSDFNLLFNQNFPIKRSKFNKNIHKISNYMTQGLLVSRLTKQKLQKISIHSPTPTNLASYKTYRNLYNSTLRASKKMYFETNLSLSKKNPKKTWQLLKEAISINSETKKINEIKLNNSSLTDPSSIANAFNKFFAGAGKNIADSLPDSPISPESFLSPNNSHDLHLGTISPGEICNIIQNSKSKLSTDIDGISMKLLKFTAIEISTPLSHIFNLSISKSTFPEAFKTSKIIPLHKSGSSTSCDNYRPIALVSTISKILEKFISIKLTNHLELNKLIHPNQFGFQRHKNTEHNLLNVINTISSAINRGEYCVGVFLDLKKAFDTVNHNILFKKLAHLGVRGSALKWFQSYLSGRSQRVLIDGVLSDPQTIDISVLQGTILGPILFLCFINDLPNASSLITFLFADDTQGLAFGKNLPTLIDTVNSELASWAKWFLANKLMVNTSKTKYIIFHSKGKQINTNKPVIFDCNVPNSPHNPSLISNLERIHNKHPSTDSQAYKLLGIYLDENLTFDRNTAYLTSKISKSIYFINRAKHFLPLKALLTLYHSLVHSHLLYCPLIYSCTSKSNLEKLTKIQKKALRIVTNSSYREHTAPLFTKHQILPLEKIILQAKLHFMHSIHYNYAPSTLQLSWPRNSERDIDHNLRNSNDYTIPRANLTFFTRFPLYTFPLAWNSAGFFTSYQNQTTFKIALSNELYGITVNNILPLPNQPLPPLPLPHPLSPPPPPTQPVTPS